MATMNCYATFAMKWNYGDSPVCVWWILQNDESWHDVVRGDGSSYSPGGPEDMLPMDGESMAEFRNRVDTAARDCDEYRSLSDAAQERLRLRGIEMEEYIALSPASRAL